MHCGNFIWRSPWHGLKWNSRLDCICVWHYTFRSEFCILISIFRWHGIHHFPSPSKRRLKMSKGGGNRVSRWSEPAYISMSHLIASWPHRRTRVPNIFRNMTWVTTTPPCKSSSFLARFLVRNMSRHLTDGVFTKYQKLKKNYPFFLQLICHSLFHAFSVVWNWSNLNWIKKIIEMFHLRDKGESAYEVELMEMN